MHVVGGRAAAPQRAFARQRHTLVAERDLREPPAVVLGADDVGGRDAHVGEEHLVELVRAGHLHERPHLDAGRAHVDDEVRDAVVRRSASGSVRASRMPQLRDVRERRPDLLAVHDVLVAVARRRCVESDDEVAARARLAEQLAPELRAVEDAGQPALLLLLGARDEQRRARPSRSRSGSSAAARRSSRMTSSISSCSAGVGVEAPGRGPVGRDVAGRGRARGSNRVGTRRPGRPRLDERAQPVGRRGSVRVGHERER